MAFSHRRDSHILSISYSRLTNQKMCTSNQIMI